MNTKVKKATSDLKYAEYQHKQRFAIRPENIAIQAKTLLNSDKFVFNGTNWNVNPYPGFAVVSMVNNNPDNMQLMNTLQGINDYFNQQLNKQETYFMLPEESYHQTIANTLSENRYIENIVNRGINGKFPEMVRNAFDIINIEKRSNPIKLKMTGVNIFGSCIAVLGEFELEDDFNTIMDFREQFYSIDEIIDLNIKWTRPFVGHITIAYLGREINVHERVALAETVTEINHSFDTDNAVFHIANTELRTYSNLSCFISEPNFPKFNFVK